MQEFLKHPAFIVILTASLTYLIGNRLSYGWTMRQKRNERALLLANQLYQAYGEFFAVWKIWNGYKDKRVVNMSMSETRRSELLERAAKAEGMMEAIFINLASEMELSTKEQEDLGNLRQAFQRLRENIQEDVSIDWRHSGNPKYDEFRRLNTFLGRLLSSDKKRQPPTPEQAHTAMKEITDNKYESYWEGGRQP